MLNKYIELVSFIGNALPDFFDVILFDTTKRGCPVVEQSNWISQWEKETRRLVLESLKNEKYVAQGCALNLMNVNVAKESICKTSIYFVKEDNRVIGALCLNTECSTLMKAEALISGILNFSDGKLIENDYLEEVNVYSRAKGLDDINRIVEAFGKEPEQMTAMERKEIFLDLYDAGVFRFKGAVPKVAEDLKMSVQSVYRYLSEIKKKRS